MELPSGTVTFLFTDIEGSTQRWDRHRDAMRSALERHDTIVRDAIVAHGGFVFKTVGDAFCAAFSTAQAGASAALEIQSALAGEDFSAIDGMAVRMALHTGTAHERDADYFGPAVNHVARLLAIGHGSQVLVSQTTAELLRSELPSTSSLQDLGAHQLRDIAHSERVFQILSPGLREEFPPLRSQAHLPTNLPPRLTSFVGRDAELAEIRKLIGAYRLATLVGPGGAGKTRCAIQVGTEVLAEFPDGVWLAELALISDPRLLPSAIAQVLGVRESQNRALLETLVAHLKTRRLLLVLDNCEHVIDEVRGIAASILRGTTGVSLLATSRESLSIAGERAFVLPSLMRFDAIALFTDRAQASGAAFSLTDENERHVVEIVTRLDGIPLAIELAAARVKVLAPEQLVARLNERFRVLTGGDRSAMPRHQTMRALIDWSFDLLTHGERSMFQTLSIFAGSFTPESVIAVCKNDVDDLETLELLASLVDKSLVQADGDGRYRLLESTRQYAREKLTESGRFEPVARAHATAFLELAEKVERLADAAADAQRLAKAQLELENWRAALEWALGMRTDVRLGQRLAVGLSPVWQNLALSEGLRWILMAQETVDATTTAAADIVKLDFAEAEVDGAMGLHKASHMAAERALAQCRELGDVAGTAKAQRLAARALTYLGRASEGEGMLQEALTTFRALGLHRLVASTLETLALARSAVDDSEGARAFYAQALSAFQAAGAGRSASEVAINLAELEFRSGNVEAAIQLAEGGLASDDAASRGNLSNAVQMCNLAAYLMALDRYDEAHSLALESLAIARRLRYDHGVLWAMQHVVAARVLQSRDAGEGGMDRAGAARVLGYIDARLSAAETLREYTEESEYQRLRVTLAEALGEAELERLMSQGRAWDEDRAVASLL